MKFNRCRVKTFGHCERERGHLKEAGDRGHEIAIGDDVVFRWGGISEPGYVLIKP